MTLPYFLHNKAHLKAVIYNKKNYKSALYNPEHLINGLIQVVLTDVEAILRDTPRSHQMSVCFFFFSCKQDWVL